MKPTITPDILYIGQDDADLRLFESQYDVPEGMCYNSYLIQDEKIAIMDTSDRRTMEQWMTDLKEALAGRQPDYLIVHHVEPDHASGIAEVANAFPGIQIICSAKAKTMIPLFFPEGDLSDRITTVKEGDTLSLGKHELKFIMAPDDWACEARRYYFNICGKYGAPVSTLLKKAAALEIEQILPLHGPVLKGEMLSEALRLYGIWSQYGVESEGVFIAHASIHGNTAEAAAKLKEILLAKGCKKVAICDLCREDQAEAIEDAFKYGKMVLAASSYDAGLFPPMYDFIHHLQLKTWQKREVALIENGSWAPSAGRVMTQMMQEMKDITIKGDLVTLRGKMKSTDIPALEALADAILA